MEDTKKRIRLTADDVVNSTDDAEKRLESVRAIKRLQQRAIDTARMEIQPILTAAKNEYLALQAQCENHVRSLQDWWSRISAAQKTKSIKLGNGQIGTRVVGGGWDMPADNELLTMIKLLDRPDLIITIEKPNKPAIKREETVHEPLGVSRRQGENQFFVQTEGDQIARYLELMALLESDPNEAA